MSHKHLHELLREDQEPFQLKNYIADRRCQLRSTIAGETALNPRKRKPLIQSTSASTTARNFCINHVCLFSLSDSPDVRKSPFLDFSSPGIKSPYNSKSPSNATTVFLHIPSRTAAMLLDAAMRIQKQKKPTYKLKPDSSKNAGFGLFGSLFKRLKDRRTRIKRREISLSSPPRSRNRISDVAESGCLYDNNTNRLTSADWSEKSSDLETSCSSWSVLDSEEIDFVGENDGFSSTEKCFCSSPSSPFRFSLVKSPSSGSRTPDFHSPATSPTHHLQQDKDEIEKSREINFDVEEDNEQCSPVSVLDPLFEDDGGVVEDDNYDLECNYGNVQRAKHKLLQKLQRFEKLAKLDPVELEKHMCIQEDDDDDDDDGVVLSEIFKILNVKQVPMHMKKLVSDLIEEERNNEVESEVVVRRVVSRLESWKMVELNTIDMMVELDFRKEEDGGWRRHDEEKIRETGVDIEVAIFGVLTEELAQELVTVSGD